MALERKKQTPEDRYADRVRLPPSRLYLDDLEAVLLVMSRESASVVEQHPFVSNSESVVTIHAGERTTLDVDDLRAATRKERRALSLAATEASKFGDVPVATMGFSGGYIWAHKSAAKQMLPVLVEAVEPFRDRRRIGSGLRLLLGLCLMAVSLATNLLLTIPAVVWVSIYLAGAGLVASLWWHTRVKVIPMRREAALEHSLSRRQALAVGLTTSATSAALGYGLGRMEQRDAPAPPPATDR